MNDTTVPSVEADGKIDLEALRAKYRQERDRRIRKEGIGQYTETAGAFGKYLEDPDVDVDARPTRHDRVEVLIIGAGWSGMLAAARLRDAGVDNLRMIDNGADFGGTWYWNRYPGVQCDIESYLYLPLLEETGYVPKEKYSYGTEIREHARRVGTHFGLYERTLFSTQVQELRWDDADACWTVATNRGDRFQASFVLMSCGSLNRPKLPGIPGILDFKGASFHTSRWDYEYTGGDTTGNLDKLTDKRVAVIGTGATGVQCTPYIADYAQHLYIVQRTPVVVEPRGNRPTDPNWAQSLTPGWQERRRANFHALVSGIRQDVDLVQDGWTEIMKILGATLFKVQRADAKTPEEAALEMEYADAQKMTEVRAHIDAAVTTPEVAAALKPWFRFFCKRPTFNDRYLGLFNRPNVTLLDTKGQGVERITATGLVIDGTEYPVDCIVFATGFEVGTEYTRRAAVELYGRNGLSLSDHWKDDYQTLHGVTVNGFPNLFFMGPTQGPGDVNFLYPAEVQARYIANILLAARERQADIVEPTKEAVSAYGEHFREVALQNLDFQRDCTPSYYNNEGDPSAYKGFLTQRYGAGLTKYRELVESWQAVGMPGLTFTRRA